MSEIESRKTKLKTGKVGKPHKFKPEVEVVISKPAKGSKRFNRMPLAGVIVTDDDGAERVMTFRTDSIVRRGGKGFIGVDGGNWTVREDISARKSSEARRDRFPSKDPSELMQMRANEMYETRAYRYLVVENDSGGRDEKTQKRDRNIPKRLAEAYHEQPDATCANGLMVASPYRKGCAAFMIPPRKSGIWLVDASRQFRYVIMDSAHQLVFVEGPKNSVNEFEKTVYDLLDLSGYKLFLNAISDEESFWRDASALARVEEVEAVICGKNLPIFDDAASSLRALTDEVYAETIDAKLRNGAGGIHLGVVRKRAGDAVSGAGMVVVSGRDKHGNRVTVDSRDYQIMPTFTNDNDGAPIFDDLGRKVGESS